MVLAAADHISVTKWSDSDMVELTFLFAFSENEYEILGIIELMYAHNFIHWLNFYAIIKLLSKSKLIFKE